MAHEPLKMSPIELPIKPEEVLVAALATFCQILTAWVSQMPPIVWGLLLVVAGLGMLRLVHALRRSLFFAVWSSFFRG